MSWLARIESACAAFIERSFAKTFPSDLEPAQIARKLVATMEAQTHGAEGALTAPSVYTVFVHPDDFERLQAHRTYLERQWAELLSEMARRVSVAFPAPVRVSMKERSSIPIGAVEIAVSDAVKRYRLRMLRGVPAYGAYLIDKELQVGRSEECDIFLLDPSVSRRHAVVAVEDGVPVVRDLGSTNGTFVNGDRVKTQKLTEGDEVMFGKTSLRLETDGPR